jgi:hypothetical protein
MKILTAALTAAILTAGSAAFAFCGGSMATPMSDDRVAETQTPILLPNQAGS